MRDMFLCSEDEAAWLALEADDDLAIRGYGINRKPIRYRRTMANR